MDEATTAGLFRLRHLSKQPQLFPLDYTCCKLLPKLLMSYIMTDPHGQTSLCKHNAERTHVTVHTYSTNKQREAYNDQQRVVASAMG